MIVRHDSRSKAFLKSSRAWFNEVPRHKSLLYAPPDKGLPIDNLTSQFFANVYLNELDQFVKHGLRAKYYGRYVDDMILFHEDAAVLNGWKCKINIFLQERLGLHLHQNKIWLNRADQGIDFVGFIIKPGRAYLRQSSLDRCRQKIRAWERKGAPVDETSLADLSIRVTSYLGMLRHVNGYKARRSLCRGTESLFVRADEDYTRLLPTVHNKQKQRKGCKK